ncbi:hypothetical protein BT93_E1268 [Corymbia citriodora subsp. variegata]|nr:hypothetical protein BT93_E1268 [Corymbia citriodora subsp. variegata]
MRLLVLATAAITVLLLLLRQGSAARPEGLINWEPIKDLNDLLVWEVAEYAVKKHNESARTKLVLEKVAKGETAGFLGTTYKLTTEVKDGADLKSYEAIVWNSKLFKILLLFKPIEGNM